MEFVHSEESLRAGGGETFCTFLSDTFTSPPAEPAATHADSGCSHASAHLNRHRVSRAHMAAPPYVQAADEPAIRRCPAGSPAELLPARFVISVLMEIIKVK